ncbi:patatin-like phospholipase family protein [Demequina sp. SO4-13]|uniref:patatin-like phospholipase family protein n=1 Tax=Demequina sp. SO4-13 TaxID=3401027 RepID=UPI003AF828FB
MEPADDLRRVPRLGLALGGGGALGAAHVGVLQVLRERGISPAVVAGTSAGAIVGAAYAVGMDPYELEDHVVRASWGTFGRFTARPGLGLLTADALRETVRTVAGEATIEDLPIDYAAVATDAETRAAVALRRGPLAEALAASIAVPGIFRPVRIDGRMLIDGGVARNLPIDTAFEMGATHVLGVRLAPEWEALGGSELEVHEWVIRPDVTLIRPVVGRRSQWVPRDLPGLVQIGRSAAEKALSDYPIVSDPPDREPPEDRREDEGTPGPLRGIARFLHRY